MCSTVQYSSVQYLVAVLVLAAAVPARGRVVEGAWQEAEAGPERVVRAEATGGAVQYSTVYLFIY